MDTARRIAASLLQIKAIKLNPANPFTWASGWRSPIYCDNRRVLSHPAVREEVARSFAERIGRLYPGAELIAGVATGAIAHGVLAADRLAKPFIYVRSSPKAHGLSNQIEGEFRAGQKVVVVEDLISTGGSSLSAVEALREAGCEVLGMVAIFTYGFDVARAAFEKAGVRLDTLSDYATLISMADLAEDEVVALRAWREDPANWGELKVESGKLKVILARP